MATPPDASTAYLAKAVTLALIMYAESFTFYPPNNPPPKSNDHAKFGHVDLITRTSVVAPKGGMAVHYTLHLLEMAALLALSFPSRPLSAHLLAHLFPFPSRAPTDLSLSPTFLLGFVFLLVGSALHHLCYTTLGRFFTYQLGLFKDHKLITSGPYAIVCHPSYTAFVLAATGLLAVLFGPGSYSYESGLLRESRWAAAGVALWVLWVMSLIVTVVGRVGSEDKVLRKEFGKEWEVWARKTPYRLVPYLY